MEFQQFSDCHTNWYHQHKIQTSCTFTLSPQPWPFHSVATTPNRNELLLCPTWSQTSKFSIILDLIHVFLDPKLGTKINCLKTKFCQKSWETNSENLQISVGTKVISSALAEAQTPIEHDPLGHNTPSVRWPTRYPRPPSPSLFLTATPKLPLNLTVFSVTWSNKLGLEHIRLTETPAYLPSTILIQASLEKKDIPTQRSKQFFGFFGFWWWLFWLFGPLFQWFGFHLD